MFEPDPPRPHIVELPTAPKPITLCGYIQSVGDHDITLVGCSPGAWTNLPREYFFRGVRRRVSGDKTSCTITISAEMRAHTTQSTYVKVIAHAAPYKFWASGSLISGWTLRATSIKKIPIPSRAS